MGAVHPIVYKIEANIIKVGTIKLISMMTLACKIIAMFTLSMGTLVVMCALHTKDEQKCLYSDLNVVQNVNDSDFTFE